MLFYLFPGYLLAINMIAFIVCGSDKRKAKNGAWRIPETPLLLLALAGGALGMWIGMTKFRHKTQHWKFRILVPLLFFIWLIGAILYGGSVFLLDYSLNPGGKAKRDKASMNFLQENFPGTAEWTDSMKSAGALRDTFIVNEKGLRLHALYATRENAEGTAILVHGYTDNALRMMMLGQLYYDTLHFNILLPDHVRHGQSEGEAIQMGWLDRLNIERWIAVSDSLWKDSPTYLHGISMGAATVMMCSGDNLSPSVRGIIEDCGYTSVWDQFEKEIQGRFGLPVHPLMDVASFLCQLRYGWNFRQASALEQVRRSTLPMLFIHGGNDNFVPTEMVYPLYAAKQTGYKQLWIAKGSAHAEAYKDYPQEYLAEMRKFLRAVKEKRERL